MSTVCHGGTALLNLKLSNNEYLIKGKRVTGFSIEEEHLTGQEQYLPFYLETEYGKRGAIYEKSQEGVFKEFGVVDGRLITGQNPVSPAIVARLVLKYFDDQQKSQK